MSLGGVSERLRRVFRAGQVCSGGSDWLARLEPFHPLPPNLTLSNIHGPPLILSLFPSSLPCIGGDSPTSQSLLERCPLLLGTPFLLPPALPDSPPEFIQHQLWGLWCLPTPSTATGPVPMLVGSHFRGENAKQGGYQG